MKIVFAADLHIGANKFGSTAERWNQPLVELVDYAIEEKADVLALAGDLSHHRRPTTASAEFMYQQLTRAQDADIQILGADGNHDDGVTNKSTSATWHLPGVWARKRVLSFQRQHINFVLLPWITPSAYLTDTNIPLQEQLQISALKAMQDMKDAVERHPEKTSILIGHAMIAYTNSKYQPYGDPPSPNLQWAGKDVVLDSGFLDNLFDHIALGHVHDPVMPFYIGSSQPTDWGDAGQDKHFYVMDDEKLRQLKCPHGYRAVRYKSSIKLLDWNFRSDDDSVSIWSLIDRPLRDDYDVGRFKYHVAAGDAEPDVETLAKIRSKLESVCQKVESFEVTKDRTVVERITTEIPLAAMRPEAAARAWLEAQSQLSEAEKKRALKEFQVLIARNA
jgi:DNA repair exonuclease SbcCD nuclease subunit